MIIQLYSMSGEHSGPEESWIFSSNTDGLGRDWLGENKKKSKSSQKHLPYTVMFQVVSVASELKEVVRAIR